MPGCAGNQSASGGSGVQLSTVRRSFAQGAVELDDAQQPNVGRIHAGCRLEEDFNNPFEKDGKFTLVLHRNHADFQVAQEIAEAFDTPDDWVFEMAGARPGMAYRHGPEASESPPCAVPCRWPSPCWR